MSIWGKIFGGVAGFAAGGPLGALAGAAVGHVVDRRLKGTEATGTFPPQQEAYAVAVVVLCAKMAKADGHVSREEIETFKRLYQVRPEEAADVGRLWEEARRTPDGFEPYARQVAEMFRHEPVVLETILSSLVLIAQADGVVHPAEQAYLERVATLFGLDASRFARASAAAEEPDEEDPYTVLGVAPGDDAATIKAAWRRLMRENHPDAVQAQGMPPEFVEVANRRMAAINAAWDRIRKERGLS